MINIIKQMIEIRKKRKALESDPNIMILQPDEHIVWSYAKEDWVVEKIRDFDPERVCLNPDEDKHKLNKSENKLKEIYVREGRKVISLIEYRAKRERQMVK